MQDSSRGMSTSLILATGLWDCERSGGTPFTTNGYLIRATRHCGMRKFGYSEHCVYTGAKHGDASAWSKEDRCIDMHGFLGT